MFASDNSRTRVSAEHVYPTGGETESETQTRILSDRSPYLFTGSSLL